MIKSVSAAYRYKECKNKKVRRKALALIRAENKAKRKG